MRKHLQAHRVKGSSALKRARNGFRPTGSDEAINEFWRKVANGVALIEPLDMDPLPDDIPISPPQERIVGRAEARRGVQSEIERISPKRRRQALILRFFCERTCDEAGELLGVSGARVSELSTQAILALIKRRSSTVRLEQFYDQFRNA